MQTSQSRPYISIHGVVCALDLKKLISRTSGRIKMTCTLVYLPLCQENFTQRSSDIFFRLSLITIAAYPEVINTSIVSELPYVVWFSLWFVPDSLYSNKVFVENDFCFALNGSPVASPDPPFRRPTFSHAASLGQAVRPWPSLTIRHDAPATSPLTP